MITQNDIMAAWMGMLPGAFFGDTAEGAIEAAYISIPAIHIGIPQYVTLDDFAARLKGMGHVPRFHLDNFIIALPGYNFGVHNTIPRYDIIRIGAQPGRWWVRQSQTDRNVAEPERFLVAQSVRLDVRQADVLHAVAALGWAKLAVEKLAPENAHLLFEQAP